MAGVGGVEPAHRLYGVCLCQRRGLLEEFADGLVAGSPNRSGGLFGQRLIQEEAGTFARKDDDHATEV